MAEKKMQTLMQNHIKQHEQKLHLEQFHRFHNFFLSVFVFLPTMTNDDHTGFYKPLHSVPHTHTHTHTYIAIVLNTGSAENATPLDFLPQQSLVSLFSDSWSSPQPVYQALHSKPWSATNMLKRNSFFFRQIYILQSSEMNGGLNRGGFTLIITTRDPWSLQTR